LSTTRQLGPLSVLGLWTALCFAGGLVRLVAGLRRRGFAATVTAFAYYFGVMLLSPPAEFPEFLSVLFGAGLLLAGVLTFLAYLI